VGKLPVVSSADLRCELLTQAEISPGNDEMLLPQLPIEPLFLLNVN
jgi:hypothetical protein